MTPIMSLDGNVVRVVDTDYYTWNIRLTCGGALFGTIRPSFNYKSRRGAVRACRRAGNRLTDKDQRWNVGQPL